MKKMHFIFALDVAFQFADFKMNAILSLGFRVVKIRDSGPLLKRDSKNLRSFEFRV